MSRKQEMSVCYWACNNAASGLWVLLRWNHSDWKEEAASRGRGHQSSLEPKAQSGLSRQWSLVHVWVCFSMETQWRWPCAVGYYTDCQLLAKHWTSLYPCKPCVQTSVLTAWSTAVEERMASIDVFSRPHCLWGFYLLVSDFSSLALSMPHSYPIYSIGFFF